MINACSTCFTKSSCAESIQVRRSSKKASPDFARREGGRLSSAMRDIFIIVTCTLRHKLKSSGNNGGIASLSASEMWRLARSRIAIAKSGVSSFAFACQWAVVDMDVSAAAGALFIMSSWNCGITMTLLFHNSSLTCESPTEQLKRFSACIPRRLFLFVCCSSKFNTSKRLEHSNNFEG